jgi:pimeloyl-[acyl-carrier protein] methyl ester esterase
MHSGVWHQFAELLAEHFTLHLVDLPGHGQSQWQPNDLQMDNVVEQLKKLVPEKAYFLGWSLGGLIATAFSKRFPESVTKLVLLASTPCFVQKQDWPCAMEPSVFQVFATNLADDQQQTLKRFLMLQARGAEQSKATIRQLATDMAESHEPHPEALQQGLSLLIEHDARQQLSELTCPIKVILAERDTLVPVTAKDYISSLNTRINLHVLKGLGHAPFVAQPSQCSDLVREFLHA